MTATRIALITLATLSLPTLGWAQDHQWTPEVSVGVGLGHVFRFDDETFGDRLNVGAAVAIAHRSGLVIELEVDRVFGLEPKPAPCGLVNNTCIGGGRYGPREATVASLGIHYRFRGDHIQPFLFAGVGVLWTASLHTTTYTSTSPAVMVESESRDRGFGPDDIAEPLLHSIGDPRPSGGYSRMSRRAYALARTPRGDAEYRTSVPQRPYGPKPHPRSKRQ